MANKENSRSQIFFIDETSTLSSHSYRVGGMYISYNLFFVLFLPWLERDRKRGIQREWGVAYSKGPRLESNLGTDLTLVQGVHGLPGELMSSPWCVPLKLVFFRHRKRINRTSTACCYHTHVYRPKRWWWCGCRSQFHMKTTQWQFAIKKAIWFGEEGRGLQVLTKHILLYLQNSDSLHFSLSFSQVCIKCRVWTSFYYTKMNKISIICIDHEKQPICCQYLLKKCVLCIPVINIWVYKDVFKSSLKTELFNCKVSHSVKLI